MTADECLLHPWLCQKEQQPIKHIKLPTEKLKKFLIRRKWQVSWVCSLIASLIVSVFAFAYAFTFALAFALAFTLDSIDIL
jgi:hypothetical protein